MTKELRKKPSQAKLLVSALRPRAARRPAAAGPPIGDLVLDGVRQDKKKLHAYQEVCGFPQSDFVPATWLHVLTFPLHSGIMSERDWPFPAMGTVHTANSMRMFRPVSVDEVLDLNVRASHFSPHAKGASFDLVGVIKSGDETVWTGRSTYLVPGYQLPGKPVEIEREELPKTENSEKWELPADLGRQYAKASGDFNPIHLTPLTAKLFGFPTTIIHGMWTHARALAALQDELPEAYEVRVQFTKPIALPATVNFTHEDGHFGVTGDDDGKPRLGGSYKPCEDVQIGKSL